MSRDGNIVSVKLDLVRADLTINNPDPETSPTGEDALTLRSYGGCKTGPEIEVQPGNTLRVDLNNLLRADDPTCQQPPPKGLALPPGVGCFNTTNLHTHGLHVSPSGNSDNVLLSIAPQTSFPFEINIPSDHPSGTFWYHPHRHGSTAVQVASGAAGLLVVRGNRPYTEPTPQNPRPMADIDTILRDARGVPMPERRFVFQQIAYGCFQDPDQWTQIYTTNGLYNAKSSPTDPNSPANAPWTCPAATPGNPVSRGAVENFSLQLFSATIWDTNGRFTSINGVVQPTITIAAGEIQRWRFAHAGIHDTINLQVVKVTPSATAPNLISTSALAGNRIEQAADVASLCSSNTSVPQFEIAADGLTRTKMQTFSGPIAPGSIASNYLQPGYRSDVLIAFPEEGDYCLLDQASSAAESANNGGRGQGPGGQGPSQVALLAYIRVRGGTRVTGDLETYVRQALYAGNPTLPAPVREELRRGNLTPWAPLVDLPGPPAADPQVAAFAITKAGFQINGKSYDPAVVNITRQVNTTDDWLLTSSIAPHIFHIHVNPFQVIDVTRIGADNKPESIFDADGNCKPPAAIDPKQLGLANQYCSMRNTFRDTIFVENDYQIHIRTRYDRYIGEFVLHCHILDHEDAGMMLNIQIVPDLTATGGGVGMAAMKHR